MESVTVANIIKKVQEVPGVKQVLVCKNTPAAGHVTIYVSSTTVDIVEWGMPGNRPSTSLLKKVRDKILEIKPKDASASSITISAMTVAKKAELDCKNEDFTDFDEILDSLEWDAVMSTEDEYMYFSVFMKFLKAK